VTNVGRGAALLGADEGEEKHASSLPQPFTRSLSLHEKAATNAHWNEKIQM